MSPQQRKTFGKKKKLKREKKKISFSQKGGGGGELHLGKKVKGKKSRKRGKKLSSRGKGSLLLNWFTTPQKEAGKNKKTKTGRSTPSIGGRRKEVSKGEAKRGSIRQKKGFTRSSK